MCVFNSCVQERQTLWSCSQSLPLVASDALAVWPCLEQDDESSSSLRNNTHKISLKRPVNAGRGCGEYFMIRYFIAIRYFMAISLQWGLIWLESKLLTRQPVFCLQHPQALSIPLCTEPPDCISRCLCWSCDWTANVSFATSLLE